ncbi:MAG: LamG domain-containing protein, partial [Chloroflexi bacterium]|nr:LamG domain-containing protein [Chloroflexota bacterium]
GPSASAPLGSGLNTWVHVAATYDGSAWQLYINGSAAGSRTANSIKPGDVIFDNISWGIGSGTAQGADRYFQGTIDEVLIFNRALSEAELNTNRDGRYNPNDTLVVPGENLDFRGTVTNDLTDRVLWGELRTISPVLGILAADEFFKVLPAQQKVLDGTITIPADAKPQAVAIDQVAGARAYSSAETPDNLQLHAPFDSARGEQFFPVTGYGGATVQAECTGNMCPTSGEPGMIQNAAHFDGTDRLTTTTTYMDLSSENAPQGLTVGFWANSDIKSGALAKDTAVLSLYNRDAWRPSTGETFETFHMNVGLKRNDEFICQVSQYPPPDQQSDDTLDSYTLRYNAGSEASNEWNHWACRVRPDGNALWIRIYLNGESKKAFPFGGRSSSFNVDWAQGPAIIGAKHPQAGTSSLEPFKGSIDDLRLNYAELSDATVASWYNLGNNFSVGLNEDRTDSNGNPTSRFRYTGIGAQQDATSLTCDNHCPKAGVQGQYSQAAEFDGENDYLQFNDISVARGTGNKTIIGWINPDSVDGWQRIIGADADNKGFTFGLSDNQVVFTARESSTNDYRLDTPRIAPSVWTHVAATITSDNKLQFYINGQSAGGVQNLASWTGGDGNVRIGASFIGEYFGGQIDEPTIYNGVFSAESIREIYLTQVSYVEERERFDLTVDANWPTIDIDGQANQHIANVPTQLLATVKDDTSVAHVEWTVDDGTSWQNTLTCLDGQGNNAWCPLVDPTNSHQGWRGEGAYVLRMRATDVVGNVNAGWTSTLPFYVDANHPDVTLTAPADGSFAQVSRSETQQDTWHLALSGTARDPELQSNSGPGSGLANLEVWISDITDPINPLPQDRVRPSVTGDGSWQTDIEIVSQDPSGIYAIYGNAVDQVGNTTGDTLFATITLDSDAPQASFDTTGLPARAILSQQTYPTLQGTVRDLPIVTQNSGVDSVEVSFESTSPDSTFSNIAPVQASDLALYTPLDDTFLVTETTHTALDISPNQRNGTCQGNACPTDGLDAPSERGMRFDGTDDGITIPDFEPGGNEITLMAWVQPKSINQNQNVIGHGPDASAQR